MQRVEQYSDLCVLTRNCSVDQLQNCMGSKKYKLCHETMGTKTSDASCLTTLYFGNVKDALEVCETEAVPFPLKEKAFNIE